jgi:hypothetical protein
MCWACDHPGADHRSYLDHIRRMITRVGWAVQYVEDDRRHASFAYTVGLTGFGLPELVVTGLRALRAMTMLNDAADDMVSSDAPSPGTTIAMSDGSRVEVVRLPHPEAHLNIALDLYGNELRALQLVWADDRGRLPWHPVFRSNRGGQPVLGPRALAAS